MISVVKFQILNISATSDHGRGAASALVIGSSGEAHK